MSEHYLDESARPKACTCGGFSAAGSQTFVLRRFIVHLQDVIEFERGRGDGLREVVGGLARKVAQR